MTKNERIGYLDIAKGIGMLLVVIGHVEYVSEPVRQYIASFHMPLFFLISGMLIRYKEEEYQSGEELIKKKLKRIMLPYVIFSFLYLVIESARMIIKDLDGWSDILRQLYQSFCLQGVSTLWFLPALFMGELIFLWIRKNSNHVQTLCSLPTIFISIYVINREWQLFFAERSDRLLLGLVNDIMSMLVRNFFCVGLVGLGYYVGWILLKKKLPVGVEAVTGIVLMIAVGFISRINPSVDLRGMQLGNGVLFLLSSVIGTLGVILFCRAIADLPLKPIHYAFEYIGRNSLLIMVTHIEFRVLYLSIKIAAVINVVLNNNVVFSILIVVFVFLFEILIIESVNRIVPFISKKTAENS